VYEHKPDGRVAIAQATVWDTEQDAREFFDAYAQRTERRYKDALLDARTSTPTRSVWTTSEGAVVIERQGARVVVLEGLPEKVNVNALIKTLLPAES
jgi:hypothetical protein